MKFDKITNFIKIGKINKIDKFDKIARGAADGKMREKPKAKGRPSGVVPVCRIPYFMMYQSRPVAPCSTSTERNNIAVIITTSIKYLTAACTAHMYICVVTPQYRNWAVKHIFYRMWISGGSSQLARGRLKPANR